MQANLLPRPIPLSSPWPRRWLRSVADGLGSLRRGLSRPASPVPNEDVPVWGIDGLSGLSDEILRDIGVPDWVREEACARRDGRRDHLGLHVAAGGLFDRSW